MASISTLVLASGDKIPVFGLGTWKSKPGQVRSAVKHAITVGYRHIDAAATYFNETEVGEGIKDALKENPSIKREDLFVVSKLPITDYDPKYVEQTCKQSLSDLGLEYLDLYLMHGPVAWKNNGKTGPAKWAINADGSFPLDDDFNPTKTWLAMEDLVKKGLVRNLGVSSRNSKQFEHIVNTGNVRKSFGLNSTFSNFSFMLLKECSNLVANLDCSSNEPG